MLSLVFKDVVAARWFLIAAFPLYAIQLVTMASTPPALILVTLLFTSVFAFGSIALEEIQGTEMLWCSLPVERSTIVFARYLTIVAVTLGGLGMSWVLGYAGARWLPSSGESVETARLGPLPYSLMLLMILGAAAIYLPCYFRLGAGRGLILACLLGLALLVLATAAGSLIVYLGGGTEAFRTAREPSPEQLARAVEWLERMSGGLAAAISIGAAALGAGSAALAARLYAQRDC